MTIIIDGTRDPEQSSQSTQSSPSFNVPCWFPAEESAFGFYNSKSGRLKGKGLVIFNFNFFYLLRPIVTSLRKLLF